MLFYTNKDGLWVHNDQNYVLVHDLNALKCSTFKLTALRSLAFI